jgi:hypothetical protein
MELVNLYNLDCLDLLLMIDKIDHIRMEVVDPDPAPNPEPEPQPEPNEPEPTSEEK